MRRGLSKAILELLKVSSVVTMAAVAPNAIQIFKGSAYQKNDLKKYQRKVWRSAHYLHKKQLIGFGKRKGHSVIFLTDKGKKKILDFDLDSIQIVRPKRWDRRWRLVAFDIPVNLRYRAELFRKKVKQLGFYQLQKSLWVFPFECAEQIEYLRDFYEVRPYIKMILAEQLDGGKKLREHFSL